MSRSRSRCPRPVARLPHEYDLAEEPPSAVFIPPAPRPRRKRTGPRPTHATQGRAVTVDLGPYLDAVPAEVVDRLRGAKRVLAVSHENPDADTLGATLGVVRIVEALGGTADAVCTDPVPAAVRLHLGRRALPDRSRHDGALRPPGHLRLRLARADRRGRCPPRRPVRAVAAGDHRPPRLERRRRGRRLDRPRGRRDLRDGHACSPAASASRSTAAMARWRPH